MTGEGRKLPRAVATLAAAEAAGVVATAGGSGGGRGGGRPFSSSFPVFFCSVSTIFLCFSARRYWWLWRGRATVALPGWRWPAVVLLLPPSTPPLVFFLSVLFCFSSPSLVLLALAALGVAEWRYWMVVAEWSCCGGRRGGRNSGGAQVVRNGPSSPLCSDPPVSVLLFFPKVFLLCFVLLASVFLFLHSARSRFPLCHCPSLLLQNLPPLVSLFFVSAACPSSPALSFFFCFARAPLLSNKLSPLFYVLLSAQKSSPLCPVIFPYIYRMSRERVTIPVQVQGMVAWDGSCAAAAGHGLLFVMVGGMGLLFLH